MSRNHLRKSVLIGLTTCFLVAYLFFSFRNHPLLTQLTDNRLIFTSINQLAKITDIPFIFYHLYSNKLPGYQLLIKDNDLVNLQNLINQARKSNFTMVNFDQVPAVFISDTGETYNVKVRYRGNNDNHWNYPKKSWRVSLTGKDQINQLKSVDLIIPEDRGLILEHLANFRANKLNLLSPDSWFVNLYINQKSQGVYYATEKIDENFISRRNLAGTLFGEKDTINNWSAPIYSSIQFWRTYPEDENNPDFKYLEQLLNLINNPDTAAGELLNLIDLDNFLNWQVHGLLMGSFAQGTTRNIRLFYNHELGKFQLIPWDTGSRHDSYEDLNRLYNPLADRLLADPDILAQRNQLLKDYIANPDNLNEDMDFFEMNLKQIYIPLMQDNNKFYANIKYLLDIKSYRLWMQQHFNNLLNQL